MYANKFPMLDRFPGSPYFKTNSFQLIEYKHLVFFIPFCFVFTLGKWLF